MSETAYWNKQGPVLQQRFDTVAGIQAFSDYALF